MLLALLAFVVAFFHREILFEILAWATSAKQAEAGRAEIRIKAQFKKSPQLYFMNKPMLETIVLPTFFRKTLWITPDLWESLTESERETLLAWAHSAMSREVFILRFMGATDITLIDRDCLLTSVDPLAFSSLLEKLVAYRNQNPPSHLGTLLAGSSVLGPPLLSEGLHFKERINAYVEQLTRLKK